MLWKLIFCMNSRSHCTISGQKQLCNTIQRSYFQLMKPWATNCWGLRECTRKTFLGVWVTARLAFPARFLKATGQAKWTLGQIPSFFFFFPPNHSHPYRSKKSHCCKIRPHNKTSPLRKSHILKSQVHVRIPIQKWSVGYEDHMLKFTKQEINLTFCRRA